MDIEVPYGAPLPSPSCEVCHSQKKLLTCSACRVVNYCGAAHQAVHRKAHKKQCKNVARLREIVLDHLVLTQSGENTDASDDEAQVERAFVIEALMESMFDLAEALLAIPTRKAVHLALLQLTYSFKLFRTCPIEPRGIRAYTPAVFLRVDQEQECYDYIKMWCTLPEVNVFRMGHDHFTDIKGADAFEPYYVLEGLIANTDQNLDQAAALMLLKIRLLFDLQSLQNCLWLGDNSNLPQEVVDMIRQHAVSNLIRSRPAI